MPFSLATWNVENFFEVGHQTSPTRRVTQEEYDEKLRELIRVIGTIDADVIALQEVGGEEPFRDLLDGLRPNGYEVGLLGRPDGRGIRVGFLSKLQIGESEDIDEFPVEGLLEVPGIDDEGDINPGQVTAMGRGSLRVQVQPAGMVPVDIITVHLKSKLLTYPKNTPGGRWQPANEQERAKVAGVALLKRTAEAVTVRVAANKILEGISDSALVVLGDMNDVQDAATTQILCGPGGSEIPGVIVGEDGELQVATPAAFRAFDTADKGDDSRLWNLAPLIDPRERYSRVYRGRRGLIDHILVSERLFAGDPRRSDLPSVESRTDLVGIPSVGDNPNDRVGEPGFRPCGASC